MIYMLIGIQGSGKSTLSKKLREEKKCDIISTDYVRKTVPGIQEKDVWVTVYDLLAEHIREGKDAVYDATNITPKVRRRFFDELAKRGVEPKVIAYYLDTPYDECYARVVRRNTRPDELFLPLDVIKSYADSLIPPSLNEGFEEIRIVRYGEIIETKKRKLFLRNDYCGICSKELLEEFNRNGNKFYIGYGEDDESSMAKRLIQYEIGNTDASVEFINGGTMANKVVISTLLKPFEAVIACDSAHINQHETGAIEATGHKILVHPNNNGKVDLEEIRKTVNKHVDYHMVKPKMVYISNSTEYGTVYTKNELEALRKLCDELDLLLFIDGARLYTALCSKSCDYDIKYLTSVADAFTIGGAKIGMPYGEAIVFKHPIEDLSFNLKRIGATISKGFIPGIMFRTYLDKKLFVKYATLENELANKLELGLKDLGVKFLMPGETNQLFPVVTRKEYDQLKDLIDFEVWEDKGNMMVIRLVTSFMTTDEDINSCISIFKDIRDIEGLKC